MSRMGGIGGARVLRRVRTASRRCDQGRDDHRSPAHSNALTRAQGLDSFAGVRVAIWFFTGITVF